MFGYTECFTDYELTRGDYLAIASFFFYNRGRLVILEDGERYSLSDKLCNLIKVICLAVIALSSVMIALELMNIRQILHSIGH